MMTQQQAINLANSYDKELTEMYDFNEKLAWTNFELEISLEESVLLVCTLKKQLKRQEEQLKQRRLQ